MEQPFRVLKRQFGYVNISYPDLNKNTTQLSALSALSNFFDGAQQVDASRNMNAPEIGARTVYLEKRPSHQKRQDL